MLAMEAEHCGRAGRDHVFITPNYGVRTTPRAEWRVVMEGQLGTADARHGRRVKIKRIRIYENQNSLGHTIDGLVDGLDAYWSCSLH